jgi:hypothetical protein
MSTLSDLNIVLGQGEAIKEVYHVKKQHLELGQQVISQKAEHDKQQERSRVRDAGTENRIGPKEDEKEKSSKNPWKNGRKKGSKKAPLPDETLHIDIMV